MKYLEKRWLVLIMKVNHAEIVISAVKPDQYPTDGLPEIALAGRSNVGKSSLLNTLMNRRNLARTSQKPGKTQTLNFYKINDDLFFVDVPGYGYAKVSKREREKFGEMIETYFSSRDVLKTAVLLVDIRHKPSEDDQLMYNWFKHFEIPVIIIATKADKISKGKYAKHLKIISDTLDVDPNDKLIPFSSTTGLGKDKVWREFEALL